MLAHDFLVPTLVGDLEGFLKYVHGCFVCAPPRTCLVPKEFRKERWIP